MNFLLQGNQKCLCGGLGLSHQQQITHCAGISSQPGDKLSRPLIRLLVRHKHHVSAAQRGVLLDGGRSVDKYQVDVVRTLICEQQSLELDKEFTMDETLDPAIIEGKAHTPDGFYGAGLTILKHFPPAVRSYP